MLEIRPPVDFARTEQKIINYLNFELNEFSLKLAPSRNSGDEKSCASTLHAVYDKGTYKFVAHTTAINRVFLITACSFAPIFINSGITRN